MAVPSCSVVWMNFGRKEISCSSWSSSTPLYHGTDSESLFDWSDCIYSFCEFQFLGAYDWLTDFSLLLIVSFQISSLSLHFHSLTLPHKHNRTFRNKFITNTTALRFLSFQWPLHIDLHSLSLHFTYFTSLPFKHTITKTLTLHCSDFLIFNGFFTVICCSMSISYLRKQANPP